MRRFFLLALVAVTMSLATAGSARADGGPFGVGLELGSPTGLNLELYLNQSTALDGGVGFAVMGERGISVHADYLWHPIMLTEEKAFFMPVYLGVGFRVLAHDRSAPDVDDTHVGVRFPVGILFDFKKAPLDAFLEGAVVVDFIEDHMPGDRSVIDVNLGLGVRYYF